MQGHKVCLGKRPVGMKSLIPSGIGTGPQWVRPVLWVCYTHSLDLLSMDHHLWPSSLLPRFSLQEMRESCAKALGLLINTQKAITEQTSIEQWLCPRHRRLLLNKTDSGLQELGEVGEGFSHQPPPCTPVPLTRASGQASPPKGLLRREAGWARRGRGERTGAAILQVTLVLLLLGPAGRPRAQLLVKRTAPQPQPPAMPSPAPALAQWPPPCICQEFEKHPGG